ncbi:prepilin-type N-terminal cleavage/methylation domain-containing protein [Acidovorax sp. SUPP950]|uniref:prepilin-type N-terminal cleavage/methylation domain-containing protein n=1 Tax=unclassified Acidovorax TaxID=2684926 RepID=UPI0023D5F68C|nr:prepilin-type N-terminal cleavage/methylation domain-containing protein [Paracidovorax avenae]WOI44247.1 prepilin-type N-terminal cleavage/methylation domain-containing protein [Paracidovorax avenae]GKS75208.1 prepilin-type N-terminal cleavage/methylation domain-containing protein [Acidovorax sp. SUPP950]
MMKRWPEGSKALRQRGFTLVELLVVITLLSLVMLALGSALRTTAQTEERVDRRMLRTDELRVANGFLRSVLGRVSLQKRAAVVSIDESPYFFIGLPEEMAWVGVMPARYGAGGRYHFRLGVLDQASGPALVLRYLPWIDGGVAPDWSQAASYVLVDGMTGFSLRYEDANEEPPVWGAPWKAVDRLPQRVSIAIRTSAGVWPDIVIPMRVLPSSDPASDGATFGGSRS